MRLARYRRRAAAILAVAGLALLAWSGLVLVWGEPLTATKTVLAQRELREELDVRRAAWLADRASTTARRAELYDRRLRMGDAVGRIVIPRLDVSMVVVEGTGSAQLARGPGHYPMTPLPGSGGTVAIAGHRTTYLHPFRHLDDLVRGDTISLEMPYGSFRYVVFGREIVDPHDWSIIRPRSFETLVLSACHPLYSATHRIVAYARPAGSREGGPGLPTGDGPRAGAVASPRS